MESLAKVLNAFVSALLTTLLVAFPVMWLWDWLMPGIFELTTITIWQALGLSALCRFLFKK